MVMILRNRRRVKSLYAALVVMAAVISATNRHGKYNSVDGPEVSVSSSSRHDGNDSERLPLYLQQGQSESIRQSQIPLDHYQTKKRRRPPEAQLDERQQLSSSQRKLNRGSDRHDVMTAIEENRDELEQILGHPIYKAKSSKAVIDHDANAKRTSGSSSAGDTWRAGDLWADRNNTRSSSQWTGDAHIAMTGWSHDGWNFNSHYKADLDHLRTDIIHLIETTERELLPKCLRLAFHDCIGGCDGCIDPTPIDNRGLDEPVELLFPLVQKYQHSFSRADVWAYCAVVAADMAVVENRPDGLVFNMHYLGRKDCVGADEKGFGGPPVEMYTNHMTTHEMIEFFDQRFGLTPFEMVVLMGVHSAAVAVRENTGFGNRGREDGWVHDAEEYKLSNLYYSSMLTSVWELEMVENEHPVPDRYQWHFEPDGEGPIMTTSDMSLIIDPEGFVTTDNSGREGLVMCRAHRDARFETNDIDTHQEDTPLCPMAEQTRGIVQELEQDNTQFLFAFVSVLNKMITNGYDVHSSSEVAKSSKSKKISNGKSGKVDGALSSPTWMPSWWSAGMKSKQPVSQPSSSDPTSAPNVQSSALPSAEPSVVPSKRPSDFPSELPSTSPSDVPSTIPSESPSSYPSSKPSLNPTSLPSRTPSLDPSSEPSFFPSLSLRPSEKYFPSSSPSVSTRPTAVPSFVPSVSSSQSPSISPSVSPSHSPSISPSAIPTGNPTPSVRDVQPTISPKTEAPVKFVSKRPTWSPTISLFPTKAPSTKRPTWAPTISLWPTKQPSTNRPTFPPSVSPISSDPTQNPTTAIPTEESTNSRLPSSSPTASPSSSPSLSTSPTETDATRQPSPTPTTYPPSATPTISQLPTTRQIFAERLNRQMNLFGLEERLERPGTILFSRNTRQYIEWFYNDYEGSREEIRGQLSNVRAIVRVAGQVLGVEEERDENKVYMNFGRRKFHSSKERNIEHWEVMGSPSEQRFGEFHFASHGSQRNLNENSDSIGKRKLQDSGELCFGRFAGVRYTIQMSYRTSNSDVTVDEIVLEPFSTSEYRDIYLNEWLKADDPVGAFDDVRCSGEPTLVVVAPSAAPSSVTATPSVAPTTQLPSPVSRKFVPCMIFCDALFNFFNSFSSLL